MTKILVVEDEKTIALTIQYNLRREGYEAEIALDGEAGLSAFDELVPDLVVLDLMLPKLDGLTVCRKLRHKSNVPVLMLTARAEEVDKLVGLEVGADDYMTKPFGMRELIGRVRAILRRVEMDRAAMRAETLTPAVVKAADLTISTARHEVNQGNKQVELAPREFDLLLFLASHPGEVFSRDALLDQVWGYAFPGDTRTVDVHVRGIRAKLGDDGPVSRYIETVRRVGYRFR
jgi:DNA-binding response OmpR family regulator